MDMIRRLQREEDEKELPTRKKYSPPVVLNFGELSRGLGDSCVSGPGATDCSTGSGAVPLCSSGSLANGSCYVGSDVNHS